MIIETAIIPKHNPSCEIISELLLFLACDIPITPEITARKPRKIANRPKGIAISGLIKKVKQQSPAAIIAKNDSINDIMLKVFPELCFLILFPI
ncbi:hypothetical protein OD917_19585 [Flavobacterium sp. SH_e]|uniref:hypothetical protein n=1 Tax=Flavobacterium TaxID=237 RepID=UPI0021E3F21A|nr:hypothetical protein [Flavobacterium sp. SH_e]MCV2487144.1 hypothetical protein [Flavobacterium sp. SH_e]